MGRWQSEGLTEGQKRNRSRPSTPCFASGPPPHAYGTGRNQNHPKSSLSRSDGEVAAAKRLTEGPLARRHQPHQPLNHPFHIPKNLNRRHPNHHKPLPRQPRIPHQIPLHPKIMRQPIDLDDQPRISRIKIRHIHPHRMLPPKLHPTRPPPQPLPQHHLRQRHLPPKPPRFLDRNLGCLPHPNLPTRSSLWPKAMGRWQSAGLTEGQKRNVVVPHQHPHP